MGLVSAKIVCACLLGEVCESVCVCEVLMGAREMGVAWISAWKSGL